MREESVRVYLDTADWSDLQGGKAGDAESVLRGLGRVGSIMFLVSEVHLIEAAGLSHGLEQWLTYVHDFPGTYLQAWKVNNLLPEARRWSWRTVDLLKYEAGRLSELAAGPGAPAAELMAMPLTELSLDDLRQFVRESGTFTREKIYAPKAERIRDVRKARRARTKDDIRALEMLHKACAREDYQEAARLFIRWAKHPEADPSRVEEQLRTMMPLGREWVAEWLAAARPDLPDLDDGWMKGAMGLDLVFLEAVLPYLPYFVKTNQASLERVAKVWKHGGTRSAVPSLALYAALIEALHYQPKRKYEDSEIPDQMHVVYAPLVDFFTCDKRNEPPLHKALESMRDRAPTIVRTGRLHELARMLDG